MADSDEVGVLGAYAVVMLVAKWCWAELGVLCSPMTQPLSFWAILRRLEMGLAASPLFFVERDATIDRQRSTYRKVGQISHSLRCKPARRRLIVELYCICRPLRLLQPAKEAYDTKTLARCYLVVETTSIERITISDSPHR
jgi:hypothetical protein